MTHTIEVLEVIPFMSACYVETDVYDDILKEEKELHGIPNRDISLLLPEDSESAAYQDELDPH